jgi:ABC-type lipoprotein export system ATPase subunit
MNPKYIFADEPTGNLDSDNAKIVMDILLKINKEQHTTIRLVTHEEDFSAMADREIYLVDGVISHR